MLECAVRILAISQQPKARTDSCPWIDLDMCERAFVPLATLSVALEEGTQRSGAFRRNVVSLPAELIVAIDSPSKGWTNLGGTLKLGLDPNKAHVTPGSICIAPASSAIVPSPTTSSHGPCFSVCKCGQGSTITTMSIHLPFRIVSITIISIVCIVLIGCICTTFAQSNSLGSWHLRRQTSRFSAGYPLPRWWWRLLLRLTHSLVIGTILVIISSPRHVSTSGLWTSLEYWFLRFVSAVSFVPIDCVSRYSFVLGQYHRSLFVFGIVFHR